MGSGRIERSKGHTRAALLMLSMGLFVASMLLPPFEAPPMGRFSRGAEPAMWAALIAVGGMVHAVSGMVHAPAWALHGARGEDWQMFVACLLGTIANLAFLVGWVRWRPDRRIAVVAPLVGICAAIGCVVPLLVHDARMHGFFWHFGPGYWLWLAAPATLVLGKWVLGERPTTPGGFPVVAAAASPPGATDAMAKTVGDAPPPEAKARRVALAVLAVFAVLALLWWWVLPQTLLSAARGRHHGIVTSLRAIGVRADALKPALLDAARDGDFNAVRFYLQSGASPNAEEIIAPGAFYIGAPGIRTPLYESIRRNDLSTMELLLKHGADPNRFCGTPNDNHYPLDYALRKEDAAMLRLLNKYGARLPGAGQALVDLRLSDDPAALAKSARGTQLLIQAVPGDQQALLALLNAGADPNVIDPGRREPLIFNAVDSDGEALKALLSHGANPDARDRRGRTALHIAAAHRRLTSLRLLLDHGADVNAQDISGQTPLYEAVVNDFLDGVKLLLDRGGDPAIVCKGGDTALSVAQSDNQTALLNLLRRHMPPETTDLSRVPRIDIHQWQTLCWEEKRWKAYPPDRMALAQDPDAIHLENTTQGNWLATFAYTARSFEADFDAVLEVRGGRFVTVIAADGTDRTAYCDCPRDGRWHVFNVHRRGDRVSYTIDGHPAAVHLNNAPGPAFTAHIGLQIEKGRTADLRRFEAR